MHVISILLSSQIKMKKKKPKVSSQLTDGEHVVLFFFQRRTRTTLHCNVLPELDVTKYDPLGFKWMNAIGTYEM